MIGMTTALGMAVTLALSTSGSTAQERENMRWSRPVDPDLAMKLYPGFAHFLEVSGRVTLECWVETDGPPNLCEVTSETPYGLGFGAAARVVVTSGALRAARIDGRIVPSRMRTNVVFALSDEDGGWASSWTGPEPSPTALSLAKAMAADMLSTYGPSSSHDALLDELDYDRREVVAAWIDELLPFDETQELQAAALQMARLFGEEGLRRIQAGEQVEWPSEDVFLSALPEASPAEERAMEELRRRYCERYQCGSSYGVAP